LTDFESANQFGEFIRAILFSFLLSILIAIISIGRSQSHAKKISLKSGFFLLLICTVILVYGIIYVVSSILQTPWPANDFPNWAAVIIEIAVAAFISGMIFLYDKVHNKKFDDGQEKRKEYAKARISIFADFLYAVIEDKEANRINKSLDDGEKVNLITNNNELLRQTVSRFTHFVDNYNDVIVPDEVRNLERICSLVDEYTKSTLDRMDMILFNTMIGLFEEIIGKYPMNEFPKIRIADSQKDYVKLPKLRKAMDNYLKSIQNNESSNKS